MTRYRADLQRLVAGNENVALALDELRNRYFLAWDDDSGDGLCGRPGVRRSRGRRLCVDRRRSLSALGRATSGDYELLIGLNAPDAQDGGGRASRARPSRNGFRSPGASRRPSKKPQEP